MHACLRSGSHSVRLIEFLISPVPCCRGGGGCGTPGRDPSMAPAAHCFEQHAVPDPILISSDCLCAGEAIVAMANMHSFRRLCLKGTFALTPPPQLLPQSMRRDTCSPNNLMLACRL